MSVKLVCLIIAAVCFFVKGAGVNTGQVDLMNIGFGFVVLSVIV